jgi:hypothetical protein
MSRVLLSTAFLLALPVMVLADVASGPKAGDKVADFKAYGVLGVLEGKEGSYVKERKDEPTVFVFVQQEHWSRPMARFLKELDAKGKEANDKSVVVAVWLSEKPAEAKDYLPRAQMSLNFSNTSLGVFEGEKSGPTDWGINTDAHCTVVVTHKGKVVESIALQSVNETDVKKVVEALKKAK